MSEIDLERAAMLLAANSCNFLRRGADLTLSMSNARWRLADRTADTFVFRPVAPSGAYLPGDEQMVLALTEVTRVTWDRLPKQRARSQVRFHLQDGALWTFSGFLDEGQLS